MNVTMKPIGTMKSLFHFKNGTPRQASVCRNASGILKIEKNIFNNPEHSLEGLEEFSHAWVIFVFHKNNNAYSKAKVKPPRLDGRRTGVFATRSPYRPNNIGLSLLKIDKIEGSTIYFSGVDMIDGTPILDVKPYIPEYDNPVSCSTSLLNAQIQSLEEQTGLDKKMPVVPSSHIPNSPADNEESNLATSESANASGIVDLEKGFYALTAALDKVGETLTSKTLKSPNKDIKEMSQSYAVADNNDIDGSHSVLGAMGGEDDDLDTFLSGIISQAKHSLSLETQSSKDNYLQSDDFLPTSDEMKKTKLSKPKLSSGELNLSVSSEHLDENISDRKHFFKKIETLENNLSRESTNDKNINPSNSLVIAPWLHNPPVKKLKVTFTSQAMQQLCSFTKSSPDPHYRLQHLSNSEDVESAIRDVLREEPRSVYRRQHCQDSLYFFTVDVVHITCWFDEDTAQVVRLKPAASVPQLEKNLNQNS